MLNRMFGGGQCASTALALMNMIPMPFEQFPTKRKMHKANLVNKFMKFLDPPKYIKLRPMKSADKREMQHYCQHQEDEDCDDDINEC